MRATRRTIRTAAIATGAIAALALPAGAAFADSPTAPSDQQGRQQVLPGAEDPKQDPKDQVLPGKDESKKDDEKKDDTKKDESKKDESDKGEKKDESKKDDSKKDVRSFVKSVKLADGSVAKVYKLGQNHYEAEIWANGSKLDTLVAKGASATGRNNGLYVVLNPDGTVTSWVEGGKKDESKKKDQSKKDERKDEHKHERKKGDRKSDVISSVKITMPDGRMAKLIKTTDGPRVEISMPNGNFLGAIDLKDPSALNDGWTYKIVNVGKGVYKFVVIDGKNGGNSWVFDFNGKLIEKYTVQKDGKKQQQPVKTAAGVVPKGGVKAGAEGVSGASSDRTPMIAAGGGIAAAGAAGLGFAMLRRRGDQR
ncbi:hypothetical protein [Streptomyces violascens]|uniref:Uncharacterized protein n=1 Tax=Streptomyces violascens TaxID=67381 RepID=A0ABQ3R2D4_9ACTN|nr:hypothetical protein [Streptomyces violascens]GGU32126.1 hypothetical protein GCM10010289_61700 [Streptomyces violascens]GHI43594.1 hypothetical protein Sviol_80020 [Streptomyces violascens]